MPRAQAPTESDPIRTDYRGHIAGTAEIAEIAGTAEIAGIAGIAEIAGIAGTSRWVRCAASGSTMCRISGGLSTARVHTFLGLDRGCSCGCC